MFASNKSRPIGVNLDEFLSRLKVALNKCSEAIISSSHKIPQWAASCPQLLYTDKSLPPAPDLNEPGKLYISYKTDEPSAVTLVGKANDKKPINRKLNIVQQSRNKITIISEHKDFVTGKCFTCKGVGQTFVNALDQYFSCCDLKKQNYTFKTEGNVQQDGNAFLLPKVLTTKGSETWVTEIINTVKELFHLVPEDKHTEVATAIEKNISAFDQFLKARENEKIVNYYDARLWLIVEAVCQLFDPLNDNNNPADENYKRKCLRDYVIAECCKNLMKGNKQDILPGLQGYFQAMEMHLEIIEAGKQDDPTLKGLINEYLNHKLYPELEGHRERIKEYHSKCRINKEEKQDVSTQKTKLR